MKKSLVALFSVLVVLVFTASAFALHAVEGQEYQPSLVKAAKSMIELNGQIRIRGDLKKNNDFNDDAKDTTQKYDQRARFGVKAAVSENTFGVVELETTPGNSSTYDWGTMGTENKRQAMYIRQAYIAHQTNALGTLAGFKAGHMLLALGNNLFFDHTNYGDDAFILWTRVGAGELSFIDIKVDEGANGVKTQNDDLEAYVAALTMPIGDVIGLSTDVTYLRGHDKSVYDKGTQFINWGLRAMADMNVVKVNAGFEAQFGTDKKSAPDVFGNTENKHKGYAGMLGIEANAGPAAIRARAGYGSGDKVKDNGDSEGEDDAFRTLLTDNQYYTFVYDYSLQTACGSVHTGLCNTMYFNLGAGVKPSPDFKGSLDFYYLQAVEDVALNGATKKDKDLGYEIDGKIEYQISSNLAYYVEAGYLIAGNAYDRFDAAKGKDVDADNAYRVRHGIILNF